MKKLICFFLILTLVASMGSPAFADGDEERYYTVNVEYSDNVGHLEALAMMVKNGNVYVDAKALAERLGYSFADNNMDIFILNKDMSNGIPFGLTKFEYGSTRVSHTLFNRTVDNYKAPFASTRNNRGSWVPFQYALALLNSGKMIGEYAIKIDATEKRIVDCFHDVRMNLDRYLFDWADDFGYSSFDIKGLGGISHLINIFNGVLEFDSASWTGLFLQLPLQLFMDMVPYDAKYGESLVTLICTESDDELTATVENVETAAALLNDNGPISYTLSHLQDKEIGALMKECDEALKEVKSGDTPLVKYNRSYQAMEDALDSEKWFRNKFNSFSTGLGILSRVMEANNYAREFKNHDEFTVEALDHYLKATIVDSTLPWMMRDSMASHTKWFSTNTAGYVGKRFVEKLPNLLTDFGSISDGLTAQGNLALLAWSVASKMVPDIKYGLQAADSFELALYSQLFQCDALLNYQAKRDAVFSDGNVTGEELNELTQYCYVFLKSCYTTRAAALESLGGKTQSFIGGNVLDMKEKLQSLINEQEEINKDIARVLTKLKRACEAGESDGRCPFGFLPEDSTEYLKNYDDGALVEWLEKKASSTGVMNSFIAQNGGRLYYCVAGKNKGESASIWSCTPDGSDIRIVAQQIPAWGLRTLASCDDDHLAFSCGGSYGAWSIKTDGTEPVQLTDGSANLCVLDDESVADGNIVYACDIDNKGSDSWGIWSTRPDGGEARLIYKSPQSESNPSVVWAKLIGSSSDSLFYIKNRSYQGDEPADVGVYKISLKGGEPIQLVRGANGGACIVGNSVLSITEGQMHKHTLDGRDEQGVIWQTEGFAQLINATERYAYIYPSIVSNDIIRIDIESGEEETIALPSECVGMDIINNIGYIATTDDGLVIYDLASGETIGRITTGSHTM